LPNLIGEIKDQNEAEYTTHAVSVVSTARYPHEEFPRDWATASCQSRKLQLPTQEGMPTHEGELTFLTAPPCCQSFSHFSQIFSREFRSSGLLEFTMTDLANSFVGKIGENMNPGNRRNYDAMK
jgi:hypothetical protein